MAVSAATATAPVPAKAPSGSQAPASQGQGAPGAFESLLSQSMAAADAAAPPSESIDSAQSQDATPPADAAVNATEGIQAVSADAQPAATQATDPLLQLLASLAPPPASATVPLSRTTVAAESAETVLSLAAAQGQASQILPAASDSTLESPQAPATQGVRGLPAGSGAARPQAVFDSFSPAAEAGAAGSGRGQAEAEAAVVQASAAESARLLDVAHSATLREVAPAERNVQAPVQPASAIEAPLAAPSAAPAAQASTDAQPVARVVQLPAVSPQWRDSFATSVRTLIMDGVGVAELRLDPPELGPVHVRIEVADQVSNVVFAAMREDTRAAIADALPLLKDLLAQSGIALDGATVSDEVPQRDTQSEHHAGTRQRGEADEPTQAVLRRIASDRLVDTYV